MSYFARPLNKSETDLKRGRYGRIGVFCEENGEKTLIGSYLRNYSSFFDTFSPFRIGNSDFALYSPDYTTSRIMKLPSCRDIGGEEPSESGFCPVEYYVPTYIDEEVIHETNNESFPSRRVTKNRVNNPSDSNLTETRQEHKYTNGITGQECTDIISTRPLTPILYYPFAFVAGCIWGDDSSWKIQFIDLSEADKGVLKREERFGYIELPENITLKEAVNMSDYAYDMGDEDAFRIQIQLTQTFDLKSGKAIHPLD